MVDLAAGTVRVKDTIGTRLLVLEETIQARVRGVLDHYADEVEAYAQDNAPWEDRTGEARDGLTTEVQEGYHGLELILFNESDHGIWLEIAMSQRYQIIMPTLDRYGPEIMEALGAAVLA